MKKLNYYFYLVMVIMIASCDTPPTIELISTTESKAWTVEKDVKSISDKSEHNVIIDRANKLQTIEGFGGCFNELGWVALNKLSESDRKGIMNDLFAPETGANLTICRMPVGANDFSRDWYSYNENENDFAMDSFSIANDLNTLVPFIKDAKSYNPKLKIWASPWSPPSWMKWNKHYACATPPDNLAEKYRNNLPVDRQGKEGTNMFIQEEKYFKAYALYFSKFIEEYRKQEINISMIMPQNEFNSCQIFPSCTWTSTGLAEFIGKYLGPEMEKQKVDIMFGTMERPNGALVDTIINHPEAGKYIKGVGFQWAGKESIPYIHKQYPDLTLYQTEQECGDGKNNWKYCNYAWTLMKHYISNGANAYLYWNIALEEGGVSRWGWSQNSLITVNEIDKTFKYNHEYYLLKHVSHFVKKGAKLLKTSGTFTNILVFENPDKSLILIANNDELQDKQVTFDFDQKSITILLTANSFNTIKIQ